MRETVTRERVDRFLSELGRRLRRPARVILTGGASMIVRGLRAQTADIDIAYELAPEDDSAFARAILDLKEDLSTSIELAEPGHFLPMPAGREQRREYVGRFGPVDAFLDDPYAIALSKLDRGHDKDVDDVRRLAGAGFVDYDRLEGMAREIAEPGRPGALRVKLDRLLTRIALLRPAK